MLSVEKALAVDIFLQSGKTTVSYPTVETNQRTEPPYSICLGSCYVLPGDGFHTSLQLAPELLLKKKKKNPNPNFSKFLLDFN